MTLLDIAWGPLSAWLAAGATFLAALVALFGPRLLSWLQRPILSISFEKIEPFCRRTILNDGTTEAFWVRLLATNVGKSAARGCIAKVVAVTTDGRRCADIDPMQLRWCGVPDDHGFDRIHLAQNQGEYFNVLRLVQDQSHVRFETFPGYAPGHPTSLEANKNHTVTVTVAADNARPATVKLTIYYSGDFGDLPESLTAKLA